MKTWFSRHAGARVLRRLNMTHKEIAELLDGGLAVPIGKEGTAEKVHKLFYSEVDSCCFVAVQDEENGEVITILPPMYHHRLEISGDALIQARALVLGKDVPKLAPKARESAIHPPWFRINALLVNSEGGIRVVKLISFPPNQYPSIQESLSNENIQQRLLTCLQAQLNPGETLVHLLGRESKYSAPVVMTFPARP